MGNSQMIGEWFLQHRDVLLHAAVAVPVTLFFWTMGMPAGNAVWANALFWFAREQDQVWQDEDEGSGRFRRLPVIDWSANKNAEWIVPGLVGLIVGGAVA